MTGEECDDEDFDAIHAGALSEVGCIVLHSVMKGFSTMLAKDLTYSLPYYLEGDHSGHTDWGALSLPGIACLHHAH